MIYIYDKALCNDLRDSFVDDTVVKVVEPEDIVSLSAQMHEDQIKFPLIAVSRDSDTSIDSKRANFTYMHRGVSVVIDPKTNDVYNEKVVPITLGYHITVLTTNTADMDELVREILFKYTNMYFITYTLPYESHRKMRFGVQIVPDETIERRSGHLEYIQEGQLYQTIIPIRCEGAVLISYTPAHLQRLATNETEIKLQ